MITLILSWLLPLLAIIVKSSSKGVVFFRQKRVGLNGRSFGCLKLRTMIENDEADEQQAKENDPRITRFGRFLRKTNLDELPQFFNVLMGQMSIIGPRPHMLKDCIRFSFVIPSYSYRSLVRPGITGWAQVKGCHGPTDDYESIILRYYWDAQYVRKSGFLLDAKILCLTIAQGFRNFLKACFFHDHPGENDPEVIEMTKIKKASN
jgi:putative colanic acid biosynthesis UDP-glucose lipid carrier transferase